jgi:hypothetical protein
MKKYYIISLVLIVIVAIAPFALAFLGSAIANTAGCALIEAEVHGCVIQGHDYGETLYAMGMSLWMIIFTAPLAELAVILWATSLIVHLAARRRSRRRAVRQV